MIKPSLLMQKPKLVKDLLIFHSFDNKDHSCLGAYYYNFCAIDIQLDTIGKHSKISLFGIKRFHEPRILDNLYFTLTHELIHHVLHQFGCPHKYHHFATDEIEYINGGGDYD